jgi:hypothetical protein
MRYPSVFYSNYSLLAYLAAKFLVMQFDLREIITVGMVAVIDIIGSIPIIIDLRSKFGHLESGKASVTLSDHHDRFFVCRRRNS